VHLTHFHLFLISPEFSPRYYHFSPFKAVFSVSLCDEVISIRVQSILDGRRWDFSLSLLVMFVHMARYESVAVHFCYFFYSILTRFFDTGRKVP